MWSVQPADKSLQAHYCYQKAGCLMVLLTVKDGHMTHDGKIPTAMVVRCMKQHATNRNQSMDQQEAKWRIKTTINQCKTAWLKSNEGGCSGKNIEIVENPNQLMPDGPEMTGGQKHQPWRQANENYNKNANNQQKSDPFTRLQGG